jgi:peptide/nickel transport system ATP-binding protein
MSEALLDVRDLSIEAHKDGQRLGIVDRVSFSLSKGEILGLVGESGSGKTITCRAVMRLFPTGSLRISGGEINFAGRDLVTASEREMQQIRGARIGMIFQNPASHLDPVMRIGRQIAESLVLHLDISSAEANAQSIELLRQVGIPDPQRRANDFPHQFSGGMRQRAMIALALACSPELLIADEPTTALDVTVQAQILRLLLELRDKRGLSIILITHDLGVVAQTCDSIAVMYAGRICERGPKRDVLAQPFHPYTSRLIACQPSASADSGLLPSIQGQPPSPSAWPSGCRFHPRCDRAISLCRSDTPQLVAVRSEHVAACHVTAPAARADEAA